MRTRCKVSKGRKIHGNEPKSTIVNICSREIMLLHPESTVVITVQHFLATLGVTWADHRRKTCVLEHKGSGTTLWCFPVLTAHLSYILSGTTVNRFWYRCGTTLEGAYFGGKETISPKIPCPSTELRGKGRSAFKGLGFRSAQVFLLSACAH